MRHQPKASWPSDDTLRVLIVCDHESAKFGGEAILPLHSFRLLRNRSHATWLVSHARTREELSELFPDERRICYVEESGLHALMCRLGQWMPAQLAYVTTGFVSRLAVQVAQRRIVRQLIESEGINIVHQPTPVSPHEPSFICDVGAPVVIGPMNGGRPIRLPFKTHRAGLKGPC